MSKQTTTFAVDSTAYVNVVCNSPRCRRILIEENYDSANPPTQNYLVQEPVGADPVRVPKGTPFIFTPASAANDYFTENMIVGEVKTAAGSITMRQIESMEI